MKRKKESNSYWFIDKVICLGKLSGEKISNRRSYVSPVVQRIERTKIWDTIFIISFCQPFLFVIQILC